MKKLIYLGIFLFLSGNLIAQTTLSETDKLASLCKVWGFLKYYHPQVAKGKLDWDKQLMDHIDPVLKAGNKEELSKIYTVWIHSLGKVKHCRSCNKPLAKRFVTYNLNPEWMNDNSVFSDSLISMLNYIRENKNFRRNNYVQVHFGHVSFSNEKVYKDSADYPSYHGRLLSLFRYWNIVNYFYPYKYVIGEDWNKVLADMVPKFMHCSVEEYHLAMLELTARINDSHAGLVTRYTNNYFGLYWAPFTFKIIDSKVVVTGFYNSPLCLRDNICVGDVITAVDGKSIADIIAEKSKYIGASNSATKLRNFDYAIFNGQTNFVRINYERNGRDSSKVINRYYFAEFQYKWDTIPKEKPWKIIYGNVGYVNMGSLMPKDVDQAMKELNNTNAIIFDVRNYPNGTMYKISKYLNKEWKTFVKFTHPYLRRPGVFNDREEYVCGGRNKHYYKGKVVLLFNETTQSHAEFTCMALQTAPNVKCIGSQTAGADGNVTIITFPGGQKSYITGLGVFYPDGRPTQRVGIIPDIEVHPTIAGIRAHRDEVLERAMEYVRSGR